MGSTTPTKLVSTSGKRQYPRTLALFRNVSVELMPGSLPPPDMPMEGSGCSCSMVGEVRAESRRGFDMRENMVWREREPTAARP